MAALCLTLTVVTQATPYFLGIEALGVVMKALGDAARGWARSPDVGCGSTVQGALQLFRACASHDGALPECGGANTSCDCHGWFRRRGVTSPRSRTEVGTAILLLLNLLSVLGDPPGLRAGFRPVSETPAPPPARLIAQEVRTTCAEPISLHPKPLLTLACRQHGSTLTCPAEASTTATAGTWWQLWLTHAIGGPTLSALLSALVGASSFPANVAS
jgi:hypothetical protein